MGAILLAIWGDYEDGDLASSAPAQDYSVCARRGFNDEYIEEFIESTRRFSGMRLFVDEKSRVKNIPLHPWTASSTSFWEAVNREYERAVDALGWGKR